MTRFIFVFALTAAALSGCAQLREQAVGGASAGQDERPYPTTLYQPDYQTW